MTTRFRLVGLLGPVVLPNAPVFEVEEGLELSAPLLLQPWDATAFFDYGSLCMVDLWMLPLSVPTLNKPCWRCGTKVAECIQWAVLERGANMSSHVFYPLLTAAISGPAQPPQQAAG